MLGEVVCKWNRKSVTFQIQATNVATCESSDSLTSISMYMFKGDQKRGKFLPVVMFTILNSCL